MGKFFTFRFISGGTLLFLEEGDSLVRNFQSLSKEGIGFSKLYKFSIVLTLSGFIFYLFTTPYRLALHDSSHQWAEIPMCLDGVEKKPCMRWKWDLCFFSLDWFQWLSLLVKRVFDFFSHFRELRQFFLIFEISSYEQWFQMCASQRAKKKKRLGENVYEVSWKLAYFKHHCRITMYKLAADATFRNVELLVHFSNLLGKLTILHIFIPRVLDQLCE